MADRGSEAHEGEVVLRPSARHRVRSAVSAAGVIGAVLLIPGLLLGVLGRNWSPILLFAFAVVVAGGASYLGQGRNELFVGPRGIRRVSRNCDLTATWPALRAVRVRVPGDQIVVFTVETSGIIVERLRSGHSNAAEALVRHPPDGFDLRLDREAADALVEEIARRRPDLRGLTEWARSSRPGQAPGQSGA